MKLEFSQQILEKNIQISYFMNICPVGASCSVRVGGHDEANSRLSQFRQHA